MLSQRDLDQIKEIVTVNTSDILIKGFGDFFDKVLSPYFDEQFEKNEKEHAEIKENLKEHDEEFEEVNRRLDKNQLEHDRMFVRFDDIDSKLDSHTKRIKKLERIISD